MKLISENADLVETMTRLIRTYPRMSFAVAWASAHTSVFRLLKKNEAKIHRGVIGTHFYQTDPDVLAAFIGSTKVKFILQPTGVFHPKIYLFWDDVRWELLIGSANLTAGALNRNSEAMLLISGSESERSVKERSIALINSYRQAKTVTKADVKAYRAIHEIKKKDPDHLGAIFGGKTSKKPPTASSVMSMNWATYLKQIKADPNWGFDERLNLLDTIRVAFETNESFKDMDRPTRKTIAGLPNEQEEHWGWFGSMRGAGYYHQAVNNNSRHLSNALDRIPLTGTVSRRDYDRFIREFLKAFQRGRDGVGLSSRLLAMKRPDLFVCLNARNLSAFCKNTGIVAKDLDYDRYWDEVVERMMGSPWWQSPRPQARSEERAWMGRAAMLDSIFYSDRGAA